MLRNTPSPSSPGQFNPTRRRALGVFGASSLSLLASSTQASAFFFSKKSPDELLNLSRLPDYWIQRQGSNLKGYANFIDDLNLRYISVDQVIAAHAKRRGSVWNSLPPKSIWKNMGPTLKVVDRLAAELGQPVREIVSAYRSPAYNARCAGASRGSYHKSNVAVDVKFSLRPSTVSHTVRSLRSRGLFQGGVGRYYGFTHIDTRGQNVDW